MKSNLLGKHVIVRSDKAGVFFGILKAKEGLELTLIDARKVYYWSGANTVEDLADKGPTDKKNSKVTVAVSQIVLASFDQILPCTKVSIDTFNDIPVWKA
jgi:hypothetical protein